MTFFTCLLGLLRVDNGRGAFDGRVISRTPAYTPARLGFGRTLQEVERERGTAILLVEHDVEMVQAFASRLYVLDFGVIIASGATGEVMDDEVVRKAYLGELV